MAMERENRSLTIGPLGPEIHYLSIYWACGPNREQGFAREGEVFVRGDFSDK